jgi:hypothetical protein
LRLVYFCENLGGNHDKKADEIFFSPLLYQLSYLAKREPRIKQAKMLIVNYRFKINQLRSA